MTKCRRDSAIGLYDVEATAALQQQALSTASRNQLSPDAAEPDMSTASTLERGSEACLSGGTAPSPSGVQQSDDEEKAANTVTSSHGTQRHHDDSLTEADGSGQAHAETVEFWLFTMNEYVYACKLSQVGGHGALLSGLCCVFHRYSPRHCCSSPALRRGSLIHSPR
eukprot:scaffold179822_cov31-Tisochrysis_lutea.AAC.10